MTKTETIEPRVLRALDMNGMGGRMAQLPEKAAEAPEVLFVGDRFWSLDQAMPLMEYLNRLGAVTAPDLPGFGGMDSFFSIGAKPSINAYADYLAAFVKLRFRRKQIVIVSVGFGTVIATRMLQRYPHLLSRVRLLVSIGGYASSGDLDLPKKSHRTQSVMYRVVSWWLPASVLRLLHLNRWMLPRLARRSAAARTRNGVGQREAIGREISRLRDNDLRTRFYTTWELLSFDNCATRLSVPFWHVALGGQSKHRQHATEQRFRVIFENGTYNETTVTEQELPYLDAKQSAKLISPSIRRLLKRA